MKMTILSDLLFSSRMNREFELVARRYHEHWRLSENIKRIVDRPITTCSLCSSVDEDKVSVLGLYYDSMPFNSVTMLDSAAVTITSLLDQQSDDVRDETLERYIEILNPDVVRNHYFLNLCCEKEKNVNDWDVAEMLKALMLSLKTESVCLRQYANLTKLLKKECHGTCNTFLTSKKLDAIKQQKNDGSSPIYFISDRNNELMAIRHKRNNTADRIRIACRILGVELK
jgi:hypothetical protein